jgi:RimJ/RimL family protein N-acetyltransferase
LDIKGIYTMKTDVELIPDRTLEAFARGFFNEATLYGFQQTDYVRFVNHLLDITIAMKKNKKTKKKKDGYVATPEILSHLVSNVESQELSGANQLPIVGEQVKIRALNIDDDITLLNQWLNDDTGRNFLLSCSEPIMPNYRDLLAEPQNHFGIIALHSGESIGVIAYLNHDQTQRRAELRKLIADPGMRGQGLGKEAAKLWLDYGMSGLSLKKVYLTTFDTNTRNIRLNEALGFKVEGILRNEVYWDGRYRDVLRMGLWLGA